MNRKFHLKSGEKICADPLRVDSLVTNMDWFPGSQGATSHEEPTTFQPRTEEANC